jgi:hypothetical protein
MAEFLRQRTYTLLLAGALGAVGVAGCSSAGKSNGSESVITCTTDQPDSWSTIPANFDAGRIAGTLGVDTTEVTNRGVAGPATCDKPVRLQDIASGNSPILSVELKGENLTCIAFGSQEDPSKIEETADILAACVPKN